MIGLLLRLPDVGSRLWQPNVSQYAANELAGHLGGVDGVVVEDRNAGEDDCAGLGGQRHVSEMNAIEGRLPHT